MQQPIGFGYEVLDAGLSSAVSPEEGLAVQWRDVTVEAVATIRVVVGLDEHEGVATTLIAFRGWWMRLYWRSAIAARLALVPLGVGLFHAGNIIGNLSNVHAWKRDVLVRNIAELVVTNRRHRSAAARMNTSPAVKEALR